jgi:hypothetical protein
MLYVLIDGKQNVPFVLSQFEKLAVRFASLARFSHRVALVASLSQGHAQTNRNAFVQQNPHRPNRASTRALASSSAATASFRLTPGNCSRNWSSVSPPPGSPAGPETGHAFPEIRVPRSRYPDVERSRYPLVSPSSHSHCRLVSHCRSPPFESFPARHITAVAASRDE